MKSQLGTLARAGLLMLGMGGLAYAGPSGFAPLDITKSSLPVTQVQWRCDGSAGIPGGCVNNDTGEVRTRGQIRRGDDRDASRYVRERDRNEYRDRDRDRDRTEDRRRDRDDDWRWRNRDRRDDYRYRRNDGGIYLGIVPGPRYVQPAPQPRYRINLTRAHVEWCHDRWRSYRAYDNTYQPTRGPRRQCISPYS